MYHLSFVGMIAIEIHVAAHRMPLELNFETGSLARRVLRPSPLHLYVVYESELYFHLLIDVSANLLVVNQSLYHHVFSLHQPGWLELFDFFLLMLLMESKGISHHRIVSLSWNHLPHQES